jgi:hypothetical protein
MWKKYINDNRFACAEPELASHLSYWHLNNNGNIVFKQLEYKHPCLSDKDIDRYNNNNKQTEERNKKQNIKYELSRCNYCGYSGYGTLKISISANDLTRSIKSIPVARFCYICALRFFGNVEYLSISEGTEYFVTPNLGIKKAHEERLRRCSAEEPCVPHRMLFKKIEVDTGKQYIVTNDGKIEYSSQKVSKLIRVAMLCCSCNGVINRNRSYRIGEEELEVTYYKLYASWGYPTEFDLDYWYAWLCIECCEKMLQDAMKDAKPRKYVSSLQHFYGDSFFLNDKNNPHTVHMQKFYDSVWNKILERFKIKIEEYRFPYFHTPCYNYENQTYVNILNECDEAKYLNNKNSKHELNWMILAENNIKLSLVIEYIRELLLHENLDRDYLEALNKPETQEDILAEERDAKLMAENIRKKIIEKNKAFFRSFSKNASPKKKKQKQKIVQKNITVECSNRFSALYMDD